MWMFQSGEESLCHMTEAKENKRNRWNDGWTVTSCHEWWLCDARTSRQTHLERTPGTVTTGEIYVPKRWTRSMFLRMGIYDTGRGLPSASDAYIFEIKMPVSNHFFQNISSISSWEHWIYGFGFTDFDRVLKMRTEFAAAKWTPIDRSHQHMENHEGHPVTIPI